jgi:protocatechuate 3,4-dioxygenase beta subunit
MLSDPTTVSVLANDLDALWGTLVAPRPLADVPTPSCEEEETPEDRMGPYYTAGAPFRTSLVDEGMVGTRLVIRGRVRATRSSRSQAIRGLGGAIVDVWQANDAGEYDNVGFTLRGKFLADAEGNFCIETIVPGRYLDGDGYRPRHLHVIVTAEGHAPVTTQIYFAGDPFNAGDIGFKESLMLTPVAALDGDETAFDFVLAPSRS